jgi:WD40 repeat protein
MPPSGTMPHTAWPACPACPQACDTALLFNSGTKRFISTSSDKSMVTWTLQLEGPEHPMLDAKRVTVAGGPVFSLLRGPASSPTEATARTALLPVFCGTAAKEVVLWRLDEEQFSTQMVLGGHTGWVRSLAVSGRHLFSCGCNHLRVWDTSFAVPKEVAATSLFTGDILAVAAGAGRVFSAGADGSLHSWTVGKGGELAEAAARERAHDGRVTALLLDGSLLYSAGYDGAIKAWDITSLKLVLEAKAAHGGQRVHALVLAPGLAAAPASSVSSAGSSEGRSSSSSNSSNGGIRTRNESGSSNNNSSSSSSGASSSNNSSSSSSNSSSTTSSIVDAGASVTADPTGQEQDVAAAAAGGGGSSLPCSPSPPPSSSTAANRVLFSAGDDGLVRAWDARQLIPVGAPLAAHTAAVKALAVSGSRLLLSGDASGEIAVWDATAVL